VHPRFDKLIDEIRGAWRYRWIAVAAAAAIAAVGWLIVFILPDRFEANAAVLVNARTALKPALQGLAVEQDVGVQLSYVRESLLAEPQLLRIAKLGGVLPAGEVDPVRQAQLLRNLRNHIQLTVQGADDRPEMGNSGGTRYRIVYRDTDRARGLKIVSILVRTLVEETVGGKKRESVNAQHFLEAEVQDYERRLRAAENKLADFKSRHLGLMPSEQGGYFAQLQKENEAVEDLKHKVLAAVNRRSALVNQLHGDAAVSAVAAMPGAGSAGAFRGTDTVSRIAETQAHLDELLLRFTERHPQVITTREALAELKRRRAAEIESLRHGDANAAAASGASGNLVYQSIQLALNQADVEVVDLRTQLSEHETKAHQLRGLLDTAPQVEAEYAQLNRDYDVNKAQYTALLANFEKARLGERADNAGSVTFEVVQPPTASILPVWPRRGLSLTLVLFAALAAGGVLASWLDQLRPIVGSPSRLAQLTGINVIAVAGSAFPARARQARRRELWSVSLAAACLLVAFIVVFSLSHNGVRVNIPALQHLVSI
jgi:polysaccharide chain length determinant protein (PEP-CTERM system associated)